MSHADVKLTDILFDWLQRLVDEQPTGLRVGSRIHPSSAFNIWPLFSIYAMDGALSVVIIAGDNDMIHVSLYDMRVYEGNSGWQTVKYKASFNPGEPGILDEVGNKIREHLVSYASRNS